MRPTALTEQKNCTIRLNPVQLIFPHRIPAGPHPAEAVVVIRSPSPQIELEFENLLAHARQFLLSVANAELPAALRAKGGASDLVQETFAAALRNRDQFRGTTVTELRAWLRAILMNELAMFRRRFVATAAREVA